MAKKSLHELAEEFAEKFGLQLIPTNMSIEECVFYTSSAGLLKEQRTYLVSLGTKLPLWGLLTIKRLGTNLEEILLELYYSNKKLVTLETRRCEVGWAAPVPVKEAQT